MAAAHQRFGRLPWKDVVLPAVRIAEDGLTLDAELASSLNRIVRESPAFPELCRVYGKDGGQSAWAAGDRLVQPDLARSLRQIADEGPDAFYRGSIADLIVREMQDGRRPDRQGRFGRLHGSSQNAAARHVSRVRDPVSAGAQRRRGAGRNAEHAAGVRPDGLGPLVANRPCT